MMVVLLRSVRFSREGMFAISNMWVLNSFTAYPYKLIFRGSASNCEGRKLYLAYVSEGLRNSQDWKDIMKYQRKNGSLFNSPSTTAAAVAHHQESSGLNYLRSLLERYGNAVPTAYPLDIYTQLSMVDSLESLGISRHFKNAIKTVLDKTYRHFRVVSGFTVIDVPWHFRVVSGFTVAI
ncbi:Ent-kaur-16-ene synthase protein [Thalictrum thalictroides]|uniref:Ent-kaur-16-ene synthase protein n=1 Tax=Thalictrum thalictroides TaxID=46969 RepID=A0A7J6WFN7_THATH|nr:Ent-kaur-16-ene synthase protein [Thalictrum thalictroides]